MISTREIGEEILRYLAEHPASGDTMDGIVQWWLLEQDVPIGPKKIKLALEYLKARDLVMESRDRHGKILYKSACTITRQN